MDKQKSSCKEDAKVVVPVVDLNKCEGKKDCVEVCPYDVFEMRAITDNQFSDLKFVAKIKTLVHGRDKAFVVNPDVCHSCGLCVSACPEKAIKLIRI